MEITYRIPSKKVPYGYVEIKAPTSLAGFPDPTELAEWYANYIREYQAAEVKAFEAPPTQAKSPQAAKDTSVEDAIKILDEGLDGVEEIDENAPVKPWDKASDEIETEEKKPWQTDESDWDFS
jgi:hypothetical protein